MNARRLPGIVLSAAFAVGMLAGCSVVQKGTDVLAGTGKISEKDRQSINKTSNALRSTFSEITEQEEYYIGRAVAALILSRYKIYDNSGLTNYLNVMGKTISYNSDRPETFGGYHFLVLDTDEVNAMAAPGGFIFVTRGILQRCKDEEMVAAILAHEIGHVSAKHGLASIKKSRLVDAFKVLGTEATARYGPKELSQLTGIFENTLGDIIGSVVERGYDRKYEYEADGLAVKYAVRTGYDPNGLNRFLKTMTGGPAGAGAKGWFKTHPTAEDRMSKVTAQIKATPNVPKTLQLRTDRFNRSVKGLKP
jgi:beta-barrel assembly-enhancing protease